MTLRVVFWGNSQSEFSSRHFKALLDVPCEVAAVVDVPTNRRRSTNPLPAGLPDFTEECGRREIPVFAPDNPNTHAFVEDLKALSPDLFIAAGYALILKPEVLEAPSILAANFHASLLPEYRGKHPVFWALRGGEERAGLTVHVMDPGIDTGDIIYQVAVRTRRDDSVQLLYERIMDRSVKLVGRLVADAEEERVPRRPQPPGQGSYFSSVKEEDFKLEWAWGAEKIRRYIQATPGKCFVNIWGKRLAFSQAAMGQSEGAALPGTLLALGRKRGLVHAGSGALWIGRVRIEEGTEMSMAGACRQLGINVGMVLE